MNNILDIIRNDEYIFKVSNQELNKINDTIFKLKNRYNSIIEFLYQEEKNSQKFDFEKMISLIFYEKKVIVDIVNDVLSFYKSELKDLECVFLSGSYARGTNKMSSDIDLHFFYKNGEYNFIYEEIICYIISRVVNKSRDCIDPTFILNFSKDYKQYVTNLMTDKKLNIYIFSNNRKIKYSYKNGKKRRFFLQYNNSRKMENLFNYLNEELNKDNLEWLHCFEIIYGQEKFNQNYNRLYEKEKCLIKNEYIQKRIKNLIIKIDKNHFYDEKKSISKIKHFYQSESFEIIYEYISIIRLILINKNYDVRFLNLYNIYLLLKFNSMGNIKIIEQVYKYMWELRRVTVYCHDNNVNYGLHTNDIINYDLTNLDNEWKKLKIKILNNLERCDFYYE